MISWRRKHFDKDSKAVKIQVTHSERYEIRRKRERDRKSEKKGQTDSKWLIKDPRVGV